jgi:hypothetical protein
VSKKSRRLAPSSTPTVAAGEPIPVVGGREPCPCGSGKRYKGCHGREEREVATRLVSRPFEGLPAECDWVALREIVPSATVALRTTTEHGAADVNVATVLPMAWPAMRRADGGVWVGLQTTSGSGDASRDVAAALLAALAAEPGTPVPGGDLPGAGPRLQDVLDLSQPFVPVVHSGFDYWLEGVEDLTADVRESMERANSAVIPTARLTTVEAAYWCRIGEKRHLRWVMPHAEDALTDGLARLHAAGASALVDGSRYVGAFRADGLLVPVWDLASDTEADDLEKPAAALEQRLGDAMAVATPLTVEERRAKAGIASRQLTLR